MPPPRLAARIRCFAYAALAIAPLVGVRGTVAHAQQPLNLGFDRPSVAYADRPWGWSLGWSAFAPGAPASFTLDSTVRAEGRFSLRVVAADTGALAPPRMLMLQLPAEVTRGRALRLRGSVRERGLRGAASVHLEAWGDRVVPAGDSIVLHDAAVDSGWRSFDLAVRVPDDATIHSIVLMVGVRGSGTAWFDAITLDLDGLRITELPGHTAAVTAAQRAWLARRTAPISTLSPISGDRHAGRRVAALDPDLALVSRIVGNARLVGLGESTHGTREFFVAKHRLLAHLARDMGFDVFAIEANQLAVETLNAFVLGGPGTARDAMRVLFRVWNTEEMLGLVEWMRAHNDANPQRRVRFIGYDMQDHWTPGDSLDAFARRVAPAWEGRVRALTSAYRAQPSFVMPNAPDSARAAWLAAADSLWQEASARRAGWLSVARSHRDTIAVEWAVHSADLLRQAASLNRSLNSPDRDSLMAANLDWAMRTLYPTSRAVVWAHDVHVSHGGDRRRSFNAGAQMGAHLKRTYGYDYRAFSFLTRAGAYRATRGLADHEMIAAAAYPAPPGSVEALLATLPRARGSVGLVADVRVPEHDQRGSWLWQPRPIRHIGYAAYDYGFEIRAVMPLEFDGVVFVERTSAARPLR